jgi:hypothetical protein
MVSDKGKLEHWTKQIQSWQTSGLSRRAYCEREGLKITTFDYWQSRLRMNKQAAKSEQLGGDRLTLVPVRLVKPNEEGFVLRSPGGWEMHLPSGIDGAWLTEILRGLP